MNDSTRARVDPWRLSAVAPRSRLNDDRAGAAAGDRAPAVRAQGLRRHLAARHRRGSEDHQGRAVLPLPEQGCAVRAGGDRVDAVAAGHGGARRVAQARTPTERGARLHARRRPSFSRHSETSGSPAPTPSGRPAAASAAARPSSCATRTRSCCGAASRKASPAASSARSTRRWPPACCCRAQPCRALAQARRPLDGRARWPSSSSTSRCSG